MKTCRCDKCGLRWPEDHTAPFLLRRHVQYAFAYQPQTLCFPCYRESYPNAFREYLTLRERRERQLDKLLARIEEEDDEDRATEVAYRPGLEPPV